MIVSIKDQIIRELARLNMWRDVASEDEIEAEVSIAHDRINGLLDQLDLETALAAVPSGTPL